MARQPNPQELKQRALQALDESRAALAGSWQRTREQWQPSNFIQHGLEKHWLAAAATTLVAGFVAYRWFFPSRENRRDSFSKPARKRTFSSFLLNGLWGMGREPLKALAMQQLLPLVAKYFSDFHSPSKPSSPE